MATQTITSSKPRAPFKFGRLIIYLILISISVFYILPVYLILTTSLKRYTDINSLYSMWELRPLFSQGNCTNPLLFCFDSFYEAWFGSTAVIGMGQAFTNSVAMTIPATV